MEHSGTKIRSVRVKSLQLGNAHLITFLEVWYAQNFTCDAILGGKLLMT